MATTILNKLSSCVQSNYILEETPPIRNHDLFSERIQTTTVTLALN